PGPGLTPLRELARRTEGLAGTVRLRWRVEPRFGYGVAPTRIERRGPFAVAASGADAVAVCAWDGGRASIEDHSIAGSFEVSEGRRALLALSAAHAEPLVFPSRSTVEARLDATA